MSITLELAPEVEVGLRRQAQAQDLPLEEYLRVVVERAGRHTMPQKMSREEFEREWALLAVDRDDLPTLTDQDLTREALYADHD